MPGRRAMLLEPDLASTRIVDVCFLLDGATIADDYAAALAAGILVALPWLADEPQAGILPLGGLARGDGIRYVGRRSRRTLRVPSARVADARALVGTRVDLDGPVQIGECSERPLGPSKVVHCAFVDMGTHDELGFLQACRESLDARDMAGELVCGRARSHADAGGHVRGHSLMIYGLTPVQTVALQERGLGGSRLLGCGHFIPHKNVAAVGGE